MTAGMYEVQCSGCGAPGLADRKPSRSATETTVVFCWDCVSHLDEVFARMAEREAS